MLAIPIQIKVCLFIYPNMRHDVALVYWTLVVPTKEASIEVALLCCLLHLASIKIVVTFDYADLDVSSPSWACFGLFAALIRGLHLK